MEEKMDGVTLYTFQTQGHDITERHEPGEDYTDPFGPFHLIAEYLGWEHWVWTFQRLQDFENEWLVMDKMRCCTLWVLCVPKREIRWCDMDLQCNRGMIPVSEWFCKKPDLIRGAGHTPEGLVRAPVRREWVKGVLPARYILPVVSELMIQCHRKAGYTI
jgi:hypothetical protein